MKTVTQKFTQLFSYSRRETCFYSCCLISLYIWMLVFIHANKNPKDHTGCLKLLLKWKSIIPVFQMSCKVFFQIITYLCWTKIHPRGCLVLCFSFCPPVVPVLLWLTSTLCTSLPFFISSSWLKAVRHQRWRFVEMAWGSLASTWTTKAS